MISQYFTRGILLLLRSTRQRKIIPSPLHKIAHRVNINVGHSITADALPAILGAFYGRDALQLTALCD
jgi:hypothetical protein